MTIQLGHVLGVDGRPSCLVQPEGGNINSKVWKLVSVCNFPIFLKYGNSEEENVKDSYIQNFKSFTIKIDVWRWILMQHNDLIPYCIPAIYRGQCRKHQHVQRNCTYYEGHLWSEYFTRVWNIYSEVIHLNSKPSSTNCWVLIDYWIKCKSGSERKAAVILKEKDEYWHIDTIYSCLHFEFFDRGIEKRGQKEFRYRRDKRRRYYTMDHPPLMDYYTMKGICPLYQKSNGVEGISLSEYGMVSIK